MHFLHFPMLSIQLSSQKYVKNIWKIPQSRFWTRTFTFGGVSFTFLSHPSSNRTRHCRQLLDKLLEVRPGFPFGNDRRKVPIGTQRRPIRHAACQGMISTGSQRLPRVNSNWRRLPDALATWNRRNRIEPRQEHRSNASPLKGPRNWPETASQRNCVTPSFEGVLTSPLSLSRSLRLRSRG